MIFNHFEKEMRLFILCTRPDLTDLTTLPSLCNYEKTGMIIH